MEPLAATMEPLAKLTTHDPITNAVNPSRGPSLIVENSWEVVFEICAVTFEFCFPLC